MYFKLQLFFFRKFRVWFLDWTIFCHTLFISWLNFELLESHSKIGDMSDMHVVQIGRRWIGLRILKKKSIMKVAKIGIAHKSSQSCFLFKSTILQVKNLESDLINFQIHLKLRVKYIFFIFSRAFCPINILVLTLTNLVPLYLLWPP